MRLTMLWMRAATCAGRPLAGPSSTPWRCWYSMSCLTFSVAIGRLPSASVAELQLPDRQHAAAVVAEHADIDFAALDVLLGDRRGADPLVDERHALGQRLVGLDDRGLGNAHRRVFVQALDDQRKREPRRPLDLAADRKDGEGRRRHAVIVHELLRQILAVRQHQAARVAAGVGHVGQFEKAHHVWS